MINYLNFLKPSNQHTEKEQGIGEPQKVESQGALRLFLGQLKEGQLLEGTLTKSLEGVLLLEIEGGLKLPVFLRGEVPLGEEMSFEVISHSKQLILKAINNPIFGGELLEGTLKTLGLPKSEEMKLLIQTFIQKGLPLDKESLLQTYHMHRVFDIPKEVLINIMEEGSKPSLSELKEMSLLKETALQDSFKQITNMIESIEVTDDLQKVLKGLLELIEPKTSHLVFKTLSETFEKSSFIRPDLQTIDKKEIYGSAEKKFPTASGMLESLDDKRIQEIKEIVPTKVEIETLLSEKLKRLLESDLVVGKTFFKNLNRELLNQLLKVDFKHIEELPEESQKLYETTKVAKALIDVLEMTDSLRGKEELTQVREQMMILDKWNVEGQYYLFSLSFSKEKEETGELYFFNPKSRKHKKSSHLYMVLALKMPHLKALEVHIRKEEHIINIAFKVENEDVKELIKGHTEVIYPILSSMGFSIGEIKITLKEEVQIKPEYLKDYKYHHMDFKI